MEETPARPSLARRALALVVLLAAGFFLAKVVIGFLAGMITLIVIVIAVLAVFWALRTL